MNYLTDMDGRTEYVVERSITSDAYLFSSVTDLTDLGGGEFVLKRKIDAILVRSFLEDHHLPSSGPHLAEAAMHMAREWADPKIRERFRYFLYGPDHMLAPDPAIDAAIITERELKTEREERAQLELESNPLFGAF